MTVFQFLTICDHLKRILRTGWLLCGIPPSMAENVAAHSHTTAITAYILAQQSNQKIDISRLLLMALIHDLPEVQIGDIPISAQKIDSRFKQAKETAEKKAMENILTLLPEGISNQLSEIWAEFLKGETLEARLVEAADRLATVLHASELVKSGYSAERFTAFLNNAESTITRLGISNTEDLLAQLSKVLGS
jgi:putative hydrolase of HD superfamily